MPLPEQVAGSMEQSIRLPMASGGGYRSSRCVCTKPRYLPVGVSSGGRHTSTAEAAAGMISSCRMWASASATVVKDFQGSHWRTVADIAKTITNLSMQSK